MKKLNAVPLLLLAMLSLISCDLNKKERDETNQRLLDVNTRIINTQSAVSETKAAVDSLDRLVSDERTEVTTNDLALTNYLLDHKMATAAIIGGALGADVAANFQNEYTTRQQILGGVVTIIALAWSWNNMDEVKEVLNTSISFHEKKQALTSQISDNESLSLSKQTELNGYTADLSRFNYQVDSLKNRLQALK